MSAVKMSHAVRLDARPLWLTRDLLEDGTISEHVDAWIARPHRFVDPRNGEVTWLWHKGEPASRRLTPAEALTFMTLPENTLECVRYG